MVSVRLEEVFFLVGVFAWWVEGGGKSALLAFVLLFTAGYCEKSFEQLCNWPICPKQIAAFWEGGEGAEGLGTYMLFPTNVIAFNLLDLHNLLSFESLIV